MENSIYASEKEIEAIKSGSSRADATILIRLLNRICKSVNGDHYYISHSSKGYCLTCVYGNKKIRKQMRGVVGTTSVITKHGRYCFSESHLCGNIRQELEKVADLSECLSD